MSQFSHPHTSAPSNTTGFGRQCPTSKHCPTSLLIKILFCNIELCIKIKHDTQIIIIIHYMQVQIKTKVYSLISLAKKMNIWVLLVLIFKSKLLHYNIHLEYSNICIGLQGIQPIIQYHQRTSQYIIISTVLDFLLDFGQADPSVGFFPDLYKIKIYIHEDQLSRERKATEIIVFLVKRQHYKRIPLTLTHDFA